MAAIDEVRKLALALPEVTERTSYGTSAFFAGKKLMARFWEDHETLALKMTFEERDMRIEVMPDLFFLTPHYQDYEMVLLHAEKAAAPLLEEVLETAWRMAATKKMAKAREVLSAEWDLRTSDR